MQVLFIAALIVGFVLAFAFVSKRRDNQDRTAITVFGCVGTFALAMIATILGTIV